MKKINRLKRLAILAVIVGLLAGAAAAQAAPGSPEQDCLDGGGKWFGESPGTGACYVYEAACETFPDATGLYIAIHFDDYLLTFLEICVPLPGGPGPTGLQTCIPS